MLQKPLVFVDIETTGQTIGRSKIIELAVIRVENNKIIDEFSSLVDPETHIDSFITSLTGITNSDVKNSQVFPLVFRQCAHLFKDAIFVAHNVSFDYNFIKNELASVGYNFSLPRLCTVKLARRLYPEYKSHSLQSLINRHDIKTTSRHRAQDDVRATYAWWQIAHTENDETVIFSHIQQQLKKQISLTQIDPSAIATLPKTTGVYIFYDKNKNPLYVGKSINIQDRVVSHLNSAHLNKTDFKLAQTATDIKGIPTAGELTALLLESKIVKELQPLLNQKLREKKRQYVAYETCQNNYKTVNLVLEKSLDFTNNKILGIYGSKKAYSDHVHELAIQHKLCKYLLGVDKQSPCFARQLNQCKGACENLENPIIYNLRFDIAFTQSVIKPWPFSGSKIIQEYNQEFDLSSTLTIDNWVISDEEPNLDTYKILRAYFSKK